ncbi:hypothetical protein ACFL59_08185 [Planctomycetota bacterium]
MSTRSPLLFVLLVALSAAMPGVAAATGDPRDTVAAGADPAITASATDGLIFEWEQGAHRVHVGGRFALDYLRYDRRNVRDSGLRLKHALPSLDVSVLELVTLRLVVDTIGVDTRYGIYEAWLSLAPTRLARLTAGVLRVPLGMEHAIPEGELSFSGYGFAAHLDGRHDLAARLEGEIEEGLLSYDLSYAFGEGYDLTGQRLGHPQLALRTVTYPFRSAELSVTPCDYEIPLLSGLFGSIALAYSPSFEGRLDVSHPLGNKMFTVPRLRAQRSFFRHFGYGMDAGPLRFAHEVVTGGLRRLETPAGTDTDLEEQITAWQASLAVMVTGEHYDSRPFRQREARGRDAPAHSPADHKDEEARWEGAVEVAARYANADIDRRFFDLGITGYNVSSQEFRTFSGAVSWYPNRNLRLSAQIVRTLADQYPAAFDSHGRDTSFAVRVQYRF